MTKYAAFGATLSLGIQQVETATVVLDGAAITTPGNATVITTCTGMTGTPITTSVAVLLGDTADTVAQKIRTALLAVANITALFDVLGSGNQIILRKKVAAANIANLNINIADGTCDGITAAATSADTIAGIVPASIGGIRGMNAPSLSLDTEDVTTHDSPGAWEELVATILRSGEVTLDLVYDPNLATHKESSGLLGYLNDKTRVYFDFVFLSTYNWTFEGFVTAFEPDAPHDGALSASVTIKIDSDPVLE